MSAAERRAIREQANRFDVVRSLQPKLTKQERRAKVKYAMEVAGVAWMIRRMFS